MNITGRYKKKQVEGEWLSILSSIRNEIQENWDNTYMNAKYNPGSVFQGKVVNKKEDKKNKGKIVRMSSPNSTVNSWTSPIKGCFSYT
jgi:hypothetical protein